MNTNYNNVMVGMQRHAGQNVIGVGYDEWIDGRVK